MMEAPRPDRAEFSVADTLTHADSVIFIQGGVLEGPKEPPFPIPRQCTGHQKSSKKRYKTHEMMTDSIQRFIASRADIRVLNSVPR